MHFDALSVVVLLLLQSSLSHNMLHTGSVKRESRSRPRSAGSLEEWEKTAGTDELLPLSSSVCQSLITIVRFSAPLRPFRDDVGLGR
jgi:hypothetical protein